MVWPARTSKRSAAALGLVVLAAVALILTVAVTNGAGAGHASRATIASTTSPGGIQIVQSSTTFGDNQTGPVNLAPGKFDDPTRAGDLLVAAVLCGTVQNGIRNADISLGSGWLRGSGIVGGYLGDGLQSDVWYYPDNPGGITGTGSLGTVPSGTTAYCTTFLWELSGAGTTPTVDTTGTADVPSNRGVVTVRSDRATTRADDLVLAAETDGSGWHTGKATTYSVSPAPWNVGSESVLGYAHQPGAFAYEPDVAAGSEPTITFRMNQEPEDGVAVLVALTTSAPG